MFTDSQYGFSKGKGTDTAVFDLSMKLFQDINDDKVSSCLFLDYSRAFNIIDHCILLRKLKMYGFGERSLCWLLRESFSKDCTWFSGVL